MRWVPLLKCLLPDTRECQRLRHVLSDIKWCCFLRIQALGPLTQHWKPPGVDSGGQGVYRVGSHGGATVGWEVVKSYLLVANEI
jgi:hypothetical protein